MSNRQRIGGRTSFSLYIGLIAILTLALVLAVVFFVVVPERQRQGAVEAQRGQATATAEALAAEVQRTYAAGDAFAAAEDWEMAAGEFAKVVSQDPGYKDAATRLAEARSNAETAKATAAAETAAASAKTAATATAQAISELESTYQRGLAYMSLNRWDQAKSELDKVIERDPQFQDVRAKLVEVESKLSEIKAMTPTATVVPTATAVPVVKSPSLRWLGFIGDQVGTHNTNSPDGNSDGVFELTIPDEGRTIVYTMLATPDGREHWRTDGLPSWVLGVLEDPSGRRLNQIGAGMAFTVKGVAKLRLYAAVAGTGFRPGQSYIVTVRFSDGYSLELPITIP